MQQTIPNKPEVKGFYESQTGSRDGTLGCGRGARIQESSAA
jgi:hypothetical protein